MADTTQNSPADLPGDLGYASIDSAFAATNVAYGMDGGAMSTIDSMASTSYQEMIGSGWTQLPLLQGEDITADHYQGVAFYKVVNGITEVIIANRGTQPGGPSANYDLIHSDALLAIGVEPRCNQDALNFYNAVTQWLDGNVTGPVQIIETGHSLGGEEADFVQAKISISASA